MKFEEKKTLILQASSPTKTPTKKSPVRAKATLYGLSSLRRDGDVIVNVMNSQTTVRSKFLVGPLTLKVEKEVRTQPIQFQNKPYVFHVNQIVYSRFKLHSSEEELKKNYEVPRPQLLKCSVN